MPVIMSSIRSPGGNVVMDAIRSVPGLTSASTNGTANLLIEGEPLTLNVNQLPETQGQVELQSSDGLYQSILTITTWDAATNTVIATGARGELPYGVTDAVLILEASDGSEFDRAEGITVQAPAGTLWVNGSSPSTANHSVFKDAIAPPTGAYQVIWRDPNAISPVINSAGEVIEGTAEGEFPVAAWDAVDGTTSGEVTYTIVSQEEFIAPTITGVTVPESRTYWTGMDLDFTVELDEAVNVSGSPRLALDIGGIARYAAYVSGAGSASLLFRYTVQADEQDLDGVTITALDLSGGTIKDGATNDADLTLNGVEDTTGVVVDTTGARPSVILPIPDIEVDEGFPISLVLTDHFADAGLFEAEGFPVGTGFTYDPDTKGFAGTANNNDVQASPFIVSISATSAGGYRGDSFTITVYNEFMNLRIRPEKAPLDVEGNPVEAVLDNWALYETDPRKKTTDTVVTVLDSGDDYDLAKGADTLIDAIPETAWLHAWNESGSLNLMVKASNLELTR